MMEASELVQLRVEQQLLLERIARLEAALAAAQVRIAELEQRPPDPPAFVKANPPRRAPTPRRTRAPSHNRGRRFEAPTQVVQHALTHCPDCHRHLSGQSLARRRQVLDLPPPVPVTMTEHHLLKRYCCHCERWHTPPRAQRQCGCTITTTVAVVTSRTRCSARAFATIW